VAKAGDLSIHDNGQISFLSMRDDPRVNCLNVGVGPIGCPVWGAVYVGLGSVFDR
jgi:hypothetical protein